MVSASALLSILILSWAVGPVPTGRPDSWMPFQDQRIVSESGRHYAVIRGRHGKTPANFEFVRRRIGYPALAPAQSHGWLYEDSEDARLRERAKAARAKVARDPKDALLGTGTLSQEPLAQKLIEQPLGLLLFEQYAGVGRGQVLTWCTPGGKVAWTRDLRALFGGRPRGGYSTVSSTWWYSSWGFDSASGKAWVLSLGHEMRLVDVATGKVEVPDERLVAEIASRASASDCEALLDAAIEADQVDYRPFVSVFEKIAKDESRPLAIRLRAALVVRRGGGKPESFVGLFRSSVREASLDNARFAGVHLDEVTGDVGRSIVELTALLCREAIFPVVSPRYETDNRLLDYGRAFRRVGERGVALLRRLANNPDVPTDANLNACMLLWHGGHEGFASRLEHLLQRCGASVANSALNALIDSEPRGMHEYLVGLCATGTADPVRLAMYFERNPDRAAVPWLRKTLARWPAGSDEFNPRKIRDALRVCERAR